MPDVSVLGASEARAHGSELADPLADCVAGGASIGYMWPFTPQDTARWWEGVFPCAMTVIGESP